MTLETLDEIAAVIALALQLASEDCVHDGESGYLTFSYEKSDWGLKSLSFRKTPHRL